MTMEKLRMTSPDLTHANIEKLAEVFPTVVTESLDADGVPRRSIDFDLLRQELADHIVEGPQERYQLDWPGKRAAAFAANAPIAKTLRPVREESVNFDTTKNLFIEGDNLEALKLLQESYLGKVKLIYIDPPYNTGNDFVYDDNFTESGAEYLERSAQKSNTGDRLVANPESNGRFHSDWLSMMHPRLKLARSLLREDGVIFVSIDDTELANLWSLLSEIFGQRNAIACLPRRTKAGGGSAAHHFAIEHDYVLVFARDKGALAPMFVPHDDEYVRRYSETDDKGKYFWDTMERSSTATKPYEITAPDGRILRGKWFRSRERFLSDLQQGEVRFLEKHDGTWSVQFKQRLAEGKKARSLMVDNAFRATPNELESLGLGGVFPFPKPVHLVRHLLTAATGPDDLILDFFAGSGTTAQAVMEANAADGGSRRYITVQIAEPTGDSSPAARAGLKSIAEIARERIRRAGRKVATSTGPAGADLDLGFRALTIDTTSMADVHQDADDLVQESLSVAIDNVKPDRTDEDLLFQVLLDWGLDLAAPIAVEEVGSRRVLSVDDHALIACFTNDVTDDLVKTIAARHPLRAVFLDAGFATDAARINAEQIFREVSPETEVRTI